MVKWIILIAVFLSGIVLGYFYWDLKKGSSDVVPTSTLNDIAILHSYKDGVHRYSGQLKLDHSCYEVLTEATLNPKDTKNVILSLVTRDKLLDQKLCVHIPTSYPFSTIIETPEKVTATLKVNGKEMPMYIVETEWQNPKGTYLNLDTQ